MDEIYLIKAKLPENNYYKYIGITSRWTLDPKDAVKFRTNSFQLEYTYESLRRAHTDWLIEKVDYRHEIGTYISTYKPKYTFKEIISDIGALLLMPIAIPLIGYLALKDYILKF